MGNALCGLGIGIASPQALAYGVGLASPVDAGRASSALWTSRRAAESLAYPSFALLLVPPGGITLATPVMFAAAAALLAIAAITAARRFPASAPG